MDSAVVSELDEPQRHRAVATLVAAFIADPVERWLYPDASAYLTHFGQFVEAFGGRAFDARTAWAVDDLAAVALLRPPGTDPDDDALVRVLTETVAPAKHADMLAVAEQMRAARPTFPHWYLCLLGVDPRHQGRGLGSRLLEAGLHRADADHLPAYLAGQPGSPSCGGWSSRRGRRVRHVGSEGPILEVAASSTCEVDMETARPRAIGPAQRTIAAGPATPGMIREQAFGGDDRWVGVVRTEPGVRSGWHHHGDTETYFYVLSGAMELEFGPGGHERLRVDAGDYVHMPRGLIHREGTPPDQPAEVALVRIGAGAPVVNVEGPEPE